MNMRDIMNLIEGVVVPFPKAPRALDKGMRVGYSPEYLGRYPTMAKLNDRRGTIYKVRELEGKTVYYVKWDDGGNSGTYRQNLMRVQK